MRRAFRLRRTFCRRTCAKVARRASSSPGSTAAQEYASFDGLAMPSQQALKISSFFTEILGHRVKRKDVFNAVSVIDGGVGATIEFRNRPCETLTSNADAVQLQSRLQPLYPLPVIATSNLRRVLRQAHAKNWTVAGGGGIRLSSELSRLATTGAASYSLSDESILRGGSSMRRAYGNQDALEALHMQEPTAAVLVDPEGAVHLLLHAFARSPLVTLRVPVRAEPDEAADFYASCLGLERVDRAPALVTAATQTGAAASSEGATPAELVAAAYVALGHGVSLASSRGAAGRSRLELFPGSRGTYTSADPIHALVREMLAREAALQCDKSEQQDAAAAMRAKCDSGLSRMHPSRLVRVRVPSASVVYGRVSRREDVAVGAFSEGQETVFLCADADDLAVEVTGDSA